MSTFKVRVIGGAAVGAGIIFAGGMLMAAPASADAGPHSATYASTTMERCAGCHRAHTAKASYLLKTDEASLCATCHGAGGGGASTDVMNGIAYTDKARGTTAGALRGGGFEYALIDTTHADKYAALKVVPVLAAGAATTSAHSIDGSAQTAWGNGALGTANFGTSVNLECTSCHDPHGNGNFRILRAIPTGSATAAVNAKVATIAVSGNVATVSTGTKAHGMLSGQTVGIQGLVQYPAGTGFDATPFNGRWVITGVPSTTSYTFAFTGADMAATTVYGGYTQPAGIPDSATKSYTTTNYWAPDDDNSAAVNVTYTGVNADGTLGTPSVKASSDFMANISAWCSTCHTRYLASTNSWQRDSGDTNFTYRHTSNKNYGRNTTSQNPNCITCHVAHGSNAVMDGDNTGTATNPDGTTTGSTAGSGKLLRVDNRGTCNMCHSV